MPVRVPCRMTPVQERVVASAPRQRWVKACRRPPSLLPADRAGHDVRHRPPGEVPSGSKGKAETDQPRPVGRADPSCAAGHVFVSIQAPPKVPPAYQDVDPRLGRILGRSNLSSQLKVASPAVVSLIGGYRQSPGRVGLRRIRLTRGSAMSDAMISLLTLGENTPDGDILRETMGFAAERLVEMAAGPHGDRVVSAIPFVLSRTHEHGLQAFGPPSTSVRLYASECPRAGVWAIRPPHPASTGRTGACWP